MMWKCPTEVTIATLFNPDYLESSHHYKLSCNPSSHKILCWTVGYSDGLALLEKDSVSGLSTMQSGCGTGDEGEGVVFF